METKHFDPREHQQYEQNRLSSHCLNVYLCLGVEWIVKKKKQRRACATVDPFGSETVSVLHLKVILHRCILLYVHER